VDVGFCSPEDTFYHGVKLHLNAEKRTDRLPLPDRAGLTRGSENDLQALRRVLPEMEGGIIINQALILSRIYVQAGKDHV